jgi:DnaD/phage-associated family protein
LQAEIPENLGALGGSPMTEFEGFPAIGKGTVIPNLFFASILPQLKEPGALLAFLWVARLAQEKRGEQRFVSADEIWGSSAARESFESLGGGRSGLERGLAAGCETGALLGATLRGPAGTEQVYFLNDPASRRTRVRAQAGEIALRPDTSLAPIEAAERRPGIFRLYEEQIGTITPLVAERLIDAEDRFPAEWIQDAFREAAELNARNWRYIETILRNWAEEGRPDEAPGRDSLEDRKRRYLGGALGRGG